MNNAVFSYDNHPKKMVISLYLANIIIAFICSYKGKCKQKEKKKKVSLHIYKSADYS